MLFSFLDVSKYGVLWLSKFILEVAISYQNILSNLSPRMPHTPVFHFAILHARPTRRSIGARAVGISTPPTLYGSPSSLPYERGFVISTHPSILSVSCALNVGSSWRLKRSIIRNRWVKVALMIGAIWSRCASRVTHRSTRIPEEPKKITQQGDQKTKKHIRYRT